MTTFIERAKVIISCANNTTTLGRLAIPLLKGEIALAKGVNWTFWVNEDTQATRGQYIGALSHRVKLSDIKTSMTNDRIGSENYFWGHYFVALKLGTNVGISYVQLVKDLVIPEPGYALGGDQGVAVFQDSGSTRNFVVTLWYVRAQVGEAAAVAIAAKTSFSDVT